MVKFFKFIQNLIKQKVNLDTYWYNVFFESQPCLWKDIVILKKIIKPLQFLQRLLGNVFLGWGLKRRILSN
jgi:hypothetical protein